MKLNEIVFLKKCSHGIFSFLFFHGLSSLKNQQKRFAGGLYTGTEEPADEK